MIKKIRYILQSGQCLSDFGNKCKNDGACGKCEDEALEKLIAEHDAKVRADERKSVLDEVKNSIHNIYSQDLHCKADMCERETMGYDCEDCLATFLMGYIEDVMKAHNN